MLNMCISSFGKCLVLPAFKPSCFFDIELLLYSIYIYKILVIFSMLYNISS